MNTKPMLFAALFCCTALSVSAQTRRIEHRSHSGTARTFNASAADHFGEIAIMPILVPEEKKKPAAPDTVKIIKVKPWKQIRDSLPPKANPVYTRSAAKLGAVKGRK
jgi:hypothetical protein